MEAIHICASIGDMDITRDSGKTPSVAVNIRKVSFIIKKDDMESWIWDFFLTHSEMFGNVQKRLPEILGHPPKEEDSDETKKFRALCLFILECTCSSVFEKLSKIIDLGHIRGSIYYIDMKNVKKTLTAPEMPMHAVLHTIPDDIRVKNFVSMIFLETFTHRDGVVEIDN